MPADAFLVIDFLLHRGLGIEPSFLENLLETGFAHLGGKAAQGALEWLVVMDFDAEIGLAHGTPA